MFVVTNSESYGLNYIWSTYKSTKSLCPVWKFEISAFKLTNKKFCFGTYTQYGYIRTMVNVLVLVVLIFSQNFSTNGPYVVLNFCKFSDTMVLIFWKNFNSTLPVLIFPNFSPIQQDRFLFFKHIYFCSRKMYLT